MLKLFSNTEVRICIDLFWQTVLKIRALWSFETSVTAYQPRGVTPQMNSVFNNKCLIENKTGC